MNKSIVKVAVALLAVPTLAFGAGKAAQAPGQDIHFMKDGQLTRGVRCAAVDPSPEESARIDADDLDLSDPRRPHRPDRGSCRWLAHGAGRGGRERSQPPGEDPRHEGRVMPPSPP